ncbi:MAG TPA: hypothetical protein VKT80_13865 [Chloroflexota bacterium]|nr:hypothetical protein [Chloroflexota bacterium]
MIDLLASGHVIEQGTGQVLRTGETTRLLRPSTTSNRYSNAQINGPAERIGWSPPLTLVARARFSHPIDQLHGTAGFGFWNEAIGPGIRTIRPPRLVWFLAASPPYDVPLALGVPGGGLKAAVMNARRPKFFALLPIVPLGFLMMRSPALQNRFWPLAQRALGVDETVLDQIDPTEFHTYTGDWGGRQVRFSIDGETILITRNAPAGPLRFVAWIDNAYAIATPRGQFGMGLLADRTDRWLDLAELRIITSPAPAAPDDPAEH